MILHYSKSPHRRRRLARHMEHHHTNKKQQLNQKHRENRSTNISRLHVKRHTNRHIPRRKTDIILADEIIPYIAQTIFGDNARIFTKIIYPLIDTAIQIIGNGGPTMYLIGTILGNTWTQLLQQAVNW